MQTTTPHLLCGALLLAAVASIGCGRDPNEALLSQNVGASFAPCSASEIRFLASKHNLMTAFEPCGNNNFEHFAWSPNGESLYFQLVFTPHVMNALAANKPTVTIATPSPIGPAAWLSNSTLVIPVGPAEGDADGPLRFALYDIEQKSVFFRPIVHKSESGKLVPIRDITDVAMANDRAVLFVGQLSGAPEPTVWRMVTDDGAVDEPYPWVPKPVTSMSYTAALDVLVVGSGDTVRLFDAAQGSVEGSWTPARRGTVHPTGTWIALEHLGEPISIFHQRAWDELSERARERELQRVEQFKASLPKSYPTTIQPPTLTFVHLATNERYIVSSFYGRRFQWYEPTPFYGSFILWGFEGKEFKRNVLLGNMADRLRSMEAGRTFSGVERFSTSGEPAKLAPEPVAEPPSVDSPR